MLSITLHSADLDPATPRDTPPSMHELAFVVAHDRTLANDQRLKMIRKIGSAVDEDALTGMLADAHRLIDRFEYLEVLSFYLFAYGEPDAGEAVAEMERIYTKLSSLSAAEPRHAFAMYSARTAVWNLRGADEISRNVGHPRLTPPLPVQALTLKVPSVHGVVRVTSREWIPRRLDVTADRFILVVAGCGVASRARERINQDPELAAAFRTAGAVWAVPAGMSMNLPAVQEWNDAHPDEPLDVIAKNSDWEGVDFSALPTFHFFKSGRLVHSARGWSTDSGRPHAIIEGLRKIGVTIGSGSETHLLPP